MKKRLDYVARLVYIVLKPLYKWEPHRNNKIFNARLFTI